MFALAAFCRALPPKLACSFPSLHSHALMRALAFTLHLSSPLSPTRAVSVVRVPCYSPTLFCSFVPDVAIVLSSFRLHHFFTFQSHPSYLLYSLTLLASMHLLSSISYTSLLFLTSSSPNLLFFTLHYPYSSASPPPPTTCLCSTLVSRQLCRTLCEVSVGSCKRGTE